MFDIYFLYVFFAAVLDIGANLLLKKSDGFKQKSYGIAALVMVCLAFTFLAQAAQHMDLTVAYVSWGAMAILGTVISARILFDQRLNWRGWLGIAMVFSSIILLKTA